MNLRIRCLALFVSISGFIAAQEPIRYTVSFPEAHTHYLQVTASIPAGKPTLDLYMAVWTPGSYLVREYARNLESFRARVPGGQDLQWRKTRKNRWSVAASGNPRVEVTYRIYAREMSVQGNWVDAGFAMLNGAANFVTIAGAEKRPYEVKLNLPPSWRESISGMKAGRGPNEWVASDFDELLDSPIYAGNAPIHEFEVAGKKHYLVNEGEDVMWDGPASARDVSKIVAEYARQWGGLPYDKYVFFNMIVESGGGLEHKNSTWMGTSRWAYGNTQDPPEPGPGMNTPRGRPSRHGWHGLVSHEYFHLWNVKRLRPVELGPFDYENEVYTPSLWLAEGVTSYYGPLALRRAGLATTDQFLRDISSAIRGLQTTPGRLAQTAQESSFDAWIKLYRQNENSRNTVISYYTKGELIGFLLDAKIRKITDDTKSLDDVLRLAYERYAGPKGYTAEQFRATASEVAGADLSSWLHNALDTTEELEYNEALDWYGLRFRPETAKPGTPPRLDTGLSVNTSGGRIVVTGIRRDSAGDASGLNVDDEILAVNGYRVQAGQWPARLDSYRPGDVLDLLVARRDKLTNLRLTLAAAAPQSWNLQVRPDATDVQKAHLASWLRQ